VEATPFFADIIAGGDEGKRPYEPPNVGVYRKDGKLEFSRARNICGEMPDAGNEVSEGQRPAAHTPEPAVNSVHVIVGDPEPRTVMDQQVGAERSSQQEADCDSAGTSEECRHEGRTKLKCVIKNEITRKCEEPFVGNGQADDPQHEQ